MIRRDDTVMVISGKEKGKTAKVLRILPERKRAVVDKLNMVKHHMKPNQEMRQGGIIDKEASIHLSNLMPYCAKCAKPARVRRATDKKGKKFRACHRCGEKLGA